MTLMTGALVLTTPRAWSLEPIDDFGDQTQEDGSTPLTPQQKFLKFTSTLSCKELTAPGGPLRILLNSKAELFLEARNWSPICSPLLIYEELERLKNPSTLDQAITNVTQFMRTHDGCAQTTSDRYGGKFKAVSPASVGLKLMDDAEKKRIMRSFDTIRVSVTDQCCGSDVRCRSAMNAVGTQFCDAPKDLNQPTRCVDNGISYVGSSDWKWRAVVASSSVDTAIKRAIGTYDVKSGHVILSPYVGMNGQRVFIHELGHACSRIRRGLAIFRGKKESLQDMTDENSCEITPATVATYSPLFQKLGLTDASFQCVVAVAKSAGQKRYEAGSCPNGCPRSHLEEALAGLYPFFIGNTADLIRMNFPRSCYSFRDAKHPLLTDLLGCLVQSPQFVDRFIAATECQR